MDQSKLSKLIDKQLVSNSHQAKSAENMLEKNAGKYVTACLIGSRIKYETYSTSTIGENGKKSSMQLGLDA